MTKPVCRQEDIFALSGMSHKLSYTNLSFSLAAFSVYKDTVVAFSAHSHFGRQMPNSAAVKCPGYFQTTKLLLLVFFIRSEHTSLTEHQKETKSSVKMERRQLKQFTETCFTTYQAGEGINQIYLKAKDKGVR